MALSCGFYNSVNHDRMYNATQFSRIFDGIINDGVYMSVLKHFAVSATSGLTVAVGGGRAWFHGTWTYNDNDIFITLSAAEVTAYRIDAIVLKIDTRDSGRDNSIVVIKGEPNASNPQKPSLENEDGVFYHPLAFITLAPEQLEIIDANIENAVGVDERTPFVTGIIETISVNDLLVQWESEFDDWLDHLKDELDENQAAHLLRLIEQVTEDEFNHHHNLCNSNATYERDTFGQIYKITTTNIDESTLDVVEYDRGDPLTITETITTSDYVYTLTTTFDGDDSTQVYTKRRNEIDG